MASRVSHYLWPTNWKRILKVSYWVLFGLGCVAFLPLLIANFTQGKQPSDLVKYSFLGTVMLLGTHTVLSICRYNLRCQAPNVPCGKWGVAVLDGPTKTVALGEPWEATTDVLKLHSVESDQVVVRDGILGQQDLRALKERYVAVPVSRRLRKICDRTFWMHEVPGEPPHRWHVDANIRVVPDDGARER